MVIIIPCYINPSSLIYDLALVLPVRRDSHLIPRGRVRGFGRVRPRNLRFLGCAIYRRQVIRQTRIMVITRCEMIICPGIMVIRNAIVVGPLDMIIAKKPAITGFVADNYILGAVVIVNNRSNRAKATREKAKD